MDAVIRCTDFTQSQAHSPSVSGFFWVIILHSLLYIPHSDHQYTKYTLKPKTSHVPHGYPNLSQQHLSAGVLEERSIFLLHYWWLSAQQLNRCIKTNLGSHDCIVWIFKQLCVAEKQICSSLHHLWKALHGGSLHHPSNLISNHLPTHHAALPRLGLLSHLQRHQALSSKCTCLLGSLNFLLRAIPLLRNQLPCWNQNFTPPLSLTIPLPCLSSLHGTHHHLPSHYHTNILSVGFFFASTETQGTQRKEIRLKGFPTVFPVMSTTSDTWKMPGKYLQNEWMRYSSVWGTFKKGPCFFFLIVSQCVAKGWKAAWGCREEQEGYSGLRCHRKQPQCLSWPLLAEIRKNRLKHSL